MLNPKQGVVVSLSNEFLSFITYSSLIVLLTDNSLAKHIDQLQSSHNQTLWDELQTQNTNLQTQNTNLQTNNTNLQSRVDQLLNLLEERARPKALCGQ